MKKMRRFIVLMIFVILIFLFFWTRNNLVNHNETIHQEMEHSMSGITHIDINNPYINTYIHSVDQSDIYATFDGNLKTATATQLPSLEVDQSQQLLKITLLTPEPTLEGLSDLDCHIYIPKQYHFDLSVTTQSGNVIIDPLTLNALDIVTNQGSVDLEIDDITQIDVNTIKGNINVLYDRVETSAYFKTKEGNILSDIPFSDDKADHRYASTSGDLSIRQLSNQ